MPEDVPENVSEDDSSNMSDIDTETDDVPEDVPDDVSEDDSSDMTDTDAGTDDVTEDVPEYSFKDNSSDTTDTDAETDDALEDDEPYRAKVNESEVDSADTSDASADTSDDDEPYRAKANDTEQPETDSDAGDEDDEPYRAKVNEGEGDSADTSDASADTSDDNEPYRAKVNDTEQPETDSDTRDEDDEPYRAKVNESESDSADTSDASADTSDDDEPYRAKVNDTETPETDSDTGDEDDTIKEVPIIPENDSSDVGDTISQKDTPDDSMTGDELIDKQSDSSEESRPTIKDMVGEDEYKKYKDIYDCVDGLGVSDTYKDSLVKQLENMNPDLKGLYNDYANNLNCLDANYPGVANFDRTKNGFMFSETKDVNKGLGTGNTFFHESGHMLDYLAGENGQDLSVSNDLTSAIQEDYNDALSNIMKTDNCSLEDAQRKLSDELWKSPTESNCVSDVFGGLSGNKVSGPWGHRADYWANRPRSAVGQEAFAEITADSASNPNSLAFTQKYMPKTYDAYQNIIKGARKNG